MRRLSQNLTLRVLTAVVLGVIVGILWPDVGKSLRPLGDTFINLVKMVIAPIIFLTIVAGIATIGDLKHVGRVGGKALLYFEIVTTFALAIGIIVVNVTKPGAGLDASTMAKGDISRYAQQGESMTFVDHLTHIVPSSVVDAFAKGEILQVVFFAVLFGVALTMSGELGRNIATAANAWRRSSSRSSASSCTSPHSAPSAPWPSPSAPSDSPRCSPSAA